MRLRRQATVVLLAMLLAWLAAKGLQASMSMPRPFALGVGHLWIAHGASAGFPSVHAMVAAAWAFGLHRVLPARGWRLPALVAAHGTALAIAWSRIALGVHFPVDVVTGAVLGAALGWATTAVLRRWWTAGAAWPTGQHSAGPAPQR